MCKTAYEVIEYDPITGEIDGVLLTEALGPSRCMSTAEVFARIDEPMVSLIVELEAALFATGSGTGSIH